VLTNGCLNDNVTCTASATLRMQKVKVGDTLGGGETREQWRLCDPNKKGCTCASFVVRVRARVCMCASGAHEIITPPC